MNQAVYLVASPVASHSCAAYLHSSKAKGTIKKVFGKQYFQDKIITFILQSQ